MPLGTEVGLSPSDIVLGSDRATPKGEQPSIFWRCGQMAGWIKMPLGMKGGLGPGDFVLDGDPAPPQKRGHSPIQFTAHVYCGQMAGCIKMPLGTEVGLGPGDTVLDGDPAPPRQKKGTAPNFRLMSIVAKLLLSSCNIYQVKFENPYSHSQNGFLGI